MSIIEEVFVFQVYTVHIKNHPQLDHKLLSSLCLSSNLYFVTLYVNVYMFTALYNAFAHSVFM